MHHTATLITNIHAQPKGSMHHVNAVAMNDAEPRVGVHIAKYVP